MTSQWITTPPGQRHDIAQTTFISLSAAFRCCKAKMYNAVIESITMVPRQDEKEQKKKPPPRTGNKLSSMAKSP